MCPPWSTSAAPPGCRGRPAGRKVEVAVKQILSGEVVKANASVANPEALEWWFRDWAARNP